MYMAGNRVKKPRGKWSSGDGEAVAASKVASVKPGRLKGIRLQMQGVITMFIYNGEQLWQKECTGVPWTADESTCGTAEYFQAIRAVVISECLR